MNLSETFNIFTPPFAAILEEIAKNKGKLNVSQNNQKIFFDQNQIDVVKKAQHDNNDIYSALKQIEFNFIISDQELNDISIINAKSNNKGKEVIIKTLCMFIRWFMDVSEKNIPKYTQLLIGALFSFMESYPDYILFTNVIYYMLTLILSNENFDIREYVVLFDAFFSKNPTIPKESNEEVIKLVKRIIKNSPECTSHLELASLFKHCQNIIDTRKMDSFECLTIISMLEPLIAKRCFESLPLFTSVSKKRALSKLPKGFIDTVLKAIMESFGKDEEVKITERKEVIEEERHINIDDLPVYPKKDPQFFESFVPKQAKTLIEWIVYSCEEPSWSEKIIAKLWKKLATEVTKNTLTAASYSLVNSKHDISRNQKIIEIIFSTVVFNPDYYIPPEDDSFLGTCRDYIFSFMASNDHCNYFHLLAEKRRNFPVFLTEFICRVIPLYKEIPCTKTLTYFVNVSNNFFSNIIVTDSVEKNAELLRWSFIKLFSSIFENKEAQKTLFQSNMLTSFYSYIYSEQTMNAILAELEKFLKFCTPYEAVMTMDSLNNIINTVNAYYSTAPEDTKERFYNIIKSIVLMLFSATESKEEAISIQDIIPNIIHSVNLIKVDNKDISIIILTLLKTMKKTSFNLTKSQISKMNNILSEFDKEEIFGLIYDITFEEKGILHSSTLVLLFMVFEETEFFEKIITKIEDLIMQNSNKHEKEMHALDQYFIGYLKRVKRGESSTKYVDRILKIFVTCEAKSSTESFVSNFISLLTPIENRCISLLEKPIANTLLELILSEYWVKSVTDRIGTGETNANYKTMQERKVSVFEVCVWMRPKYTTEGRFTLIDLRKGDEYLQLFYEAKKVGMNFKGQTIIFEQEIMLDQWSFVVFKFDHDVDDNQRAWLIINEERKEKIKIPAIEFDKGTEVQIGSTEKHSSYLEIGSILIDQSPEERYLIYQDGPVATCYNEQSFCFLPMLKKSSKTNKNSFAYLLICNKKIDLVLPLFGLFEMPFEDNTLWNEAPLVAFEILSKLILLIPEQQQNLANTNKIEALQALLFSVNPSIMNYNFYKQFYSLYQMVQNIDLKRQIFSKILLNLELWISSDKEDLINIIKHWHLFINDITFFDNDYFFSIISWIKIYFSEEYKPINNKKRSEGLDLIKCRTILCQLLIKYTIPYYNKLERKYRSNVRNNISDIRAILHYISIREGPALISYEYRKEDIRRLYYLFGIGLEEITTTIIEYIVSLYINKVFERGGLQKEVNIIISILDCSNLTLEVFFERMTDMMVIAPELISLCCWYAYTTKINVSSIFRTKLKMIQPSDITVSKTFFIWPLVFALTDKTGISVKVITYIVERYINLWDIILLLTKIIAHVIDVDDDFTIRIIIFIMQNMIIENFDKGEEVSESIINNCVTFTVSNIFFTDTDHVNAHIKEMFGIEQQEEKKEEIISPKKLFQDIKKFAPNTLNNTRFGIMTDNDGRWIHEDIAKNLLECLGKSNKSYALPIVHLTCRFLSYSALNRAFVDEYAEQYPELVKKFPFEDVITKDGYVYYNDLAAIDRIRPLIAPPYASDIIKIHSSLVSSMEKSYPFELETVASDEERNAISYNSLESFRTWKILWSFLSIEGGPWFIELPKSEREVIHWKRDNSGCFGWCPAKLKRNYKLNSYSKTKPEESNKERRNSVQIFTDLYLPKNIHKKKEDISVLHGKKSYSGVIKCIKEDKECEVSLNKDFLCIIVKNKLLFKETYDSILSVYLVPTLHKRTSLNFFFFSRSSIFIDFKKDAALEIISELKKHKISQILFNKPYAKILEASGVPEQWSNGGLSNFEYLMYLNRVSGRSFSTLSQYPVFPWVIDNYDSEKLDLNDPSTFRDLSYPMGALIEEKREALDMKLESFIENEIEYPYMYASGPLSMLSVSLYLVRMEPFTQMQYILQGGHFDAKDRQVQSIGNVYDLLKNQTAEYWELIPEFFYQPEFIMNLNHYDINGISDIQLPKWASSPMDFVYKHRKALESKYVSQNLNKWIDLMWGCKQKNADAYNLYMDKLYDDVWEHYTEEDEEEIKTVLLMVGQIPAKLFSSPHIQRKFSDVQPDKSFKRFEITNFLLCGISNSKALYSIAYDDINKSYVQYKLDAKMVQTNKLFNNEKLSNIMRNEDCKVFDIMEADKIIRTSTQAYLFNLESLTLKELQSPFIGCKLIVFDLSLVLVVSDDSTVYLFKYPDTKTPIVQMQTYRDVILCAAVSQTFSSYAIGTQDKALLVGSSSKGNIVFSKNVDGVPNKVVITNSWGFIVVSMTDIAVNTQKMIAIYTINGDLIRKVECLRPESIYTFRSMHGFDYIAISDKNNTQVYEVYPMRRCLSFKTKLVPALTYFDIKQKFLITIESNGTMCKSYIDLDEY